METVTLKSRIGSFDCRAHTLGKNAKGEPHPVTTYFSWNQSNDFRETVPVKWWEEQKEFYLDRKRGSAKFKDVFLEL